jgi:hypothetical protein
MITRFSTTYGADLTPEQLEALRPHVRELPNVARYPNNGYFTYEGDVLAAKRALPGVSLKLEDVDVPLTTFEVVLERLESIERKLAAPVPAFNDRVAVSVPSFAQMMISDVTVLENSCTDQLQEHLDMGWRILAICPQPNQRRPDYVLGRT